MYTSFRLKNFRGFRDLEMTDLARFNLVAGANNVGKTALLEGLFLHLGAHNPELPLRVSAIRGIEKFRIDAETMWGWLFYNKQTKETIELRGLTDDGIERTLDIRLVEPQTAQIVASPNDGAGKDRGDGALSTAGAQYQLALDYRDSAGQQAHAHAEITPDGEVAVKRAAVSPGMPGIYLSTRTRFASEDVERFSNLERIGQHEALLPTLKLLEPRLKRLSVLVDGGAPKIHGDIGLTELMPLAFAGEGMVRLLSILLAIASCRGGVVLIDEIENGLHYSVLERVFAAIGAAARTYAVQIFATTHSWECIRAAHNAFVAGGTYDFCLHRLDRTRDQISAVSFTQASLEASIQHELEVR